MIKIIKDDRIDWFVKFIVPTEQMFRLKPVIAGGSMLSAYRAIKLHDTPEKWEEFKRSLKKNPSTAKFDKFGDIDIWFIKDNPIHNKDNESNWLLSDYSDESVCEPVVRFGPKGRPNKMPGINQNNLGLYKLNRTSRWANTYYCNKSLIAKPLTREVQFIKKRFDSVEHILSSFDFINCSIAWYDGNFYYDDRIDDAFRSFELRLNNAEPYESDSVAMKVFNAMRAFKYTDRYNLDFCPVLTNHVFKLYFESKNIDYEAYKNHVIVLEEHYGKTISSVETLQGMVRSFHGMFKKFSIMKHFKKEYPLYLLDCADRFSGLKELIGASEPVKPYHSPFYIKRPF